MVNPKCNVAIKHEQLSYMGHYHQIIILIIQFMHFIRIFANQTTSWVVISFHFFATDIGNNQVNELTTCTLLSHSSATALNDQPIDPYSHISFCFSHTLQIKHFITIPHRERNNFDTNNKSTLLMIINMIINQTKISHYVCIM